MRGVGVKRYLVRFHLLIECFFRSKKRESEDSTIVPPRARRAIHYNTVLSINTAGVGMAVSVVKNIAILSFFPLCGNSLFSEHK